MTSLQYQHLLRRIHRVINTSYVRAAWILFLLLAIPSAAYAHSSLVRSEPADGEILAQSPARVSAWFNEELDSQQSILQVFDAHGAQVDNGDGGVDLNDLDHLSMFVTLPPLPEGSYRVYWKAVSAEDGDETAGDFLFGVGVASIQMDADSATTGNNTVYLTVGAILMVGLIVAGIVIRRQSS